VFFPSSSAIGEIFNCQSYIDIEYDTDLANQPLLPIDMVLNIPVKIKYYVEGRYENSVPEIYESMGLDVIIDIEVVDTPEWCNATIIPSVILLPATPDGVYETTNLSIQINRKAHAFESGDITIKITANRMGAILGNTSYHSVSFKVGYFPMLNLDIPDGTIKSITPNEVADFYLEIENLGNSLTNVSISPIDVPDGWTVTAPSSILIDAKTFGSEAKKTFHVSIKPPYDAGYHNDRETITLAIKPSYFNNESIGGEDYYVSFVIKNKGYSTPGFEFTILLMGLLASILILKKKYNKADGGNKK